ITQVRDETTLAAEKKPYVWRAMLGADRRIMLSGYAPGQRYHQSIRAEARKLFPTGVEDRMSIARGHPTGAWDEAAIWALRQLSPSGAGEAPSVDAVMPRRAQARDADVQAAFFSPTKPAPPPYRGGAEIPLSSPAPLPAPEEAPAAPVTPIAVPV